MQKLLARSVLCALMMCLLAWPAFADDQNQPTTRPARGWLGCRLAPNEDGAGIVIKEVIEKSPAQTAGLKADDIITKINGQVIENIQTFVGEMRQAKPGDEVKFTVTRAGAEKDIAVKLGEAPPSTQEKPKRD
jgi:S1-C subfamily serine protease